MPSLPFVLPHWLYWGTLVVFPLVAMYFVQRQLRRGVPKGPSLFIAYMFWLCSGFMGLHRFYLRSNWGFVFIPVFLLILHTTDDIRDRREDVSRTRAAVGAAHLRTRPREDSGRRDARRRRCRSASPRPRPRDPRPNRISRRRKPISTRWYGYSRWLAILMAAMLVVDAILLPGLVRRQKPARPRSAPMRRPRSRAPDVPQIGTHEDPTLARAHALHRRDRVGEHPRRRVRRLLGRDLGVRLLLRGDRALRVQFADQLAAREHVPDVRHAVHDRRRLRLSVRPACARRRVLREILDARQSHRRHHHLGVLLHLRRHAALHELALRHGLVQSGRHRRSLVHRMGRAVLAGEADDADRRRAARCCRGSPS